MTVLTALRIRMQAEAAYAADATPTNLRIMELAAEQHDRVLALSMMPATAEGVIIRSRRVPVLVSR